MEDSSRRQQQQKAAAIEGSSSSRSYQRFKKLKKVVAKASAKRGHLCETKRSAWDSEFKVRSCSGGGEGVREGKQFTLALQGHLREGQKLKVAVDARPIRLILGAGGPKGEVSLHSPLTQG